MKKGFTSKATIIIDAPPTKVWEALTSPEIIKKYFFGAEAISDWKEGSAIVFIGEWEGKSYEEQGLILKISPEELFIYRYDKPEMKSKENRDEQMTVTYQLNPIDNKTELTILQEKIKDEKTKIRYQENWKKILDKLRKLLEKEHVES